MIHDPLPAPPPTEAERFTDRVVLAPVLALALLVVVHLVRWWLR